MTCKEQIRVIEASSIDHQPTDLELCRRIWQLALPVLVQQALIYLVGLSDTLITGWYLSAGVFITSFIFSDCVVFLLVQFIHPIWRLKR